MLIQLDKLVQLLESPVFTHLRLQLLEPEKYSNLYKCMYGILMLLPQSSAFATLRNRLNSVNSLGILQLFYTSVKQQTARTADGLDAIGSIKVDDLLSHFRKMQLHRESKIDRKLSVTVALSSDELKQQQRGKQIVSPGTIKKMSIQQKKPPRIPMSGNK